MNGTLLHPIITRLLNDYIPAKQRPFAGHPLGVYLRNDAPESSIKLVWWTARHI